MSEISTLVTEGHFRYIAAHTVQEYDFLRDLKRECDQARMTWPELTERATIADGAGQIMDVLAPIARAERLLQPLPADDPSREAALAHCADLRQRATLRRGIASECIGGGQGGAMLIEAAA